MNRVIKKKQEPQTATSTRTKLIKAATDLFGERGYDGASVRDIAKKAKQNIGSISYYFGDKKGLYSAVAEAIAHDMIANMREPMLEAKAQLDSGKLKYDD